MFDASVIIPAHNASKTLGAQLDALCEQETDKHLEVIVVDDRSTDSTAETARSRAAKIRSTIDGRLDVISTSPDGPHGPSAARNAGAERASSDKLLFCDADDIVPPNWAETLIAALDRHPFVVGPLNPFIDDPEKSDIPRLPNFQMWNNLCPTGASANMAIDAGLFHFLDGFDTRLPIAEDIDLCVRAHLVGWDVAPTDCAIAYRSRKTYWQQVRQSIGWAGYDALLRAGYRDLIVASGGRGVRLSDLTSDLVKTVVNPKRWPTNVPDLKVWAQQVVIKVERIRVVLDYWARHGAQG